MKITERQMNRIIRDSVDKVVSEGQFLNKVKKFAKDFMDDENGVEKEIGSIGDAKGAKGNLSRMRGKDNTDESRLRRKIGECVDSVMNRINEDYVNYNFGDTREGGFANALYRAFQAADNGNREKLMNAFPEYFDRERMYGNENDKFDYRDFPYKEKYDEHWNDWKARNGK